MMKNHQECRTCPHDHDNGCCCSCVVGCRGWRDRPGATVRARPDRSDAAEGRPPWPRAETAARHQD
ncbi:hypothetical protein C2845_PM03G31510 [Panicum miliaceum]|uniref:Uncharacterized protein n=1 Tax=Panicum miliaceum TaxID=4540 RepID=A0A3L6TE14_PANMI|nr:hypothetical protein C2845_PM03G31510 [Panicum miliaceum]